MNFNKASPILRMISWNMHHSKAAWRFLFSTDPLPDVVLLQEALKPQGPVCWSTPGLDEEWHIKGHIKGAYCSTIVGLTSRISTRPIPTMNIGDFEKHKLAVSRPGTLALAELTLATKEKIIVISAYSIWEYTFSGKRPIFADSSAHRIISDITPLVLARKNSHVLIAGDWNIFHGYGDDGSPYWKRRYDTVFDRMQALGLDFSGPQYPHGVSAQDKPSHFPNSDKNVATYRRKGARRPDSARDQLDFVFASSGLRDRLFVKALNREEEWGPSDHCRIAIDLYSQAISQ